MQAGPPTSGRGEAPRLDARLAALTAHSVQRRAEAAVADLRARYDYGHVLHTARYASKNIYGHKVVDALAATLGTDASALRRQARVSETISPEEFDELVCVRLAGGLPLSWSHLEALARLRCKHRRKEIVQAIAGTTTSVKGLRALVKTILRR
jgi:hypothetical protein